MENYICIEGKKIELTEEQLKQLGVISKPKASIEDDIVKIGEYEFIVLEKGDGVLKLLLKEMLCASKFGENNNFKGSEVEKVLAEFACKIANIVGEENLVEHTVDLTSDDGLKDYGTTEAKMSLLTCDMYRKYVCVLDEHKVDRWWWLATAYSTPTHDDDTWIKCVSPSGYIGSINYDYGSGVRPFCILKSHIFESGEGQGWLTKI